MLVRLSGGRHTLLVVFSNNRIQAMFVTNSECYSIAASFSQTISNLVCGSPY